MAGYNYRWDIEKQKEKAEEDLINYIKRYLANYSPFYRTWFDKHNIDVKKLKKIFTGASNAKMIDQMEEPQLK